MPKPQSKSFRPSLFKLVAGVFIISTVVFVSALVGYHYQHTYAQMQQEIQQTTQTRLISLSKSLAYFIDSYAINEYEKLIRNEMTHRDFKAIVINDFNMAQLLGQKNYYTGFKRVDSEAIQAIAPHATIKNAVDTCLFKQQKQILNTQGSIIGEVSICVSDTRLTKQIFNLAVQEVSLTGLFSVLFMLALFLALRAFVLSPLTTILKQLEQTHEGIPRKIDNNFGTQETHLLVDTLNQMSDFMQSSQAAIKQQTQIIAQQKERFQLAIEGAMDGLWDWNLITDETYHSERFEHILGYQGHELANHFKAWEKLIHPEDWQALNTHINDYFNSPHNKNFVAKFRMQSKQQTWLWVQTRGKAVFDANHKPIRFIGFIHDITQQVEQEKMLEHAAKHDNLTGLPNRFLFSEIMQNMMDRCQRNQTHMAILYIDLDGFKQINDQFGHQAGDQILIHTAKTLQDIIRQADMAARLGGDEFAIAVADIKHTDELAVLARRLIKALNRPFQSANNNDEVFNIAASIGIASYNQKLNIGPEALLRQADQAMYRAKHQGKNQYFFFDQGEENSQKSKQAWANSLYNAIEKQQLELYFQAKMNMHTGQTIGFEALLRWHHPQQGLLSPGVFLPHIENDPALMLALGNWVREQAFKALHLWQQQGLRINISINISWAEVNEPFVIEHLKTCLQRYPKLTPDQLELEILETAALEDLEVAKDFILQCQAIGFSISIDDFGTGYSSLRYLKELPINLIKIDQSFIRDMLENSASLSIIEAAISLASAFQVDIIAEGVASLEQGDMLILLGCLQAQGYFIARPMPQNEVQAWLHSYQPPQNWQNLHTLYQHKHTLLHALVDHRQWIKQIHQYLQHQQDLPELNPNLCRFGQWLQANAHITEQAKWQQLNTLHQQLHQQAEELVKNQGSDNEAYHLDCLENHHAKVMTLLHDIIEAAQHPENELST